jgi:dTDP-4-amino-4,6-dideoxygalactose transaminase
MTLLALERIPKQPVLSAQTFCGKTTAAIPSILDTGATQFVNRGSLALGLALRHMDVTHGDEILIPAYHCVAMVEPVISRGAKPVFFKINDDTSLDLDDVKSRLTPRSRALMAPHFFGFHQDMPKIRAFCDEHGLLLIEDCAHAFFGSTGGHPLGHYGDYVIGSAWKFFPIAEGGCLVSSRQDLSGVRILSGGPFLEAKNLVNTLEYATEYNRLGWVNPIVKTILNAKTAVLHKLKPQPEAPTPMSFPVSAPPTGFTEARVRQSAPFWVRLLLRHAPRDRIVCKRRENFQSMLQQLGAIPGMRPLFTRLPDGVVPHVFPVLVDMPETVFPQLKKAGVPVIRFGEFLWEGMAPGLCLISERYSRCVFQFPCHQDLTAADLQWMVASIREIFTQTSSIQRKNAHAMDPVPNRRFQPLPGCVATVE